ncbi:MAG: hypothetical protein L6V83_00555 [Christensenella sp.]|nr:MAG: hypothetical protein L6V83_00555 [Christensenella sp.]
MPTKISRQYARSFAPDDKGKERSLASLFVNPFFAIPFFKAVSRKEAKIAMEYVSFAEQVSEPFYNPETDCYIKNIGVAKSEQGTRTVARHA